MTELTIEERATNAETMEHIAVVTRLLLRMQFEISKRIVTHDRSKLSPPEVSTFTEMIPKLKCSTYGSEEYQGFLRDMTSALDHHYAHNRHHPEHFEACPEDKSIANHLVMAKWAIDNAQVLPDDIYGYEQLDTFLREKQQEAVSSVNNMNIIDLLEMIVDWKAASLRHADGSIERSIEINTKRFSLSPQLVAILRNSIPLLEDTFAGLNTQKDC